MLKKRRFRASMEPPSLVLVLFQPVVSTGGCGGVDVEVDLYGGYCWSRTFRKPVDETSSKGTLYAKTSDAISIANAQGGFRGDLNIKGDLDMRDHISQSLETRWADMRRWAHDSG